MNEKTFGLENIIIRLNTWPYIDSIFLYVYNQLNIKNKLGFIVNHDITEKNELQKRKREEADVVQHQQNMNVTSGFFSETNETTTFKKQKK